MHFTSEKMKASSLLLLTLLSFLTDPAVSLCPGESYSEHKDVRFGLMTAADNRLRFVSVGCIPAIELAVDLINDNGSLLSGYRLTHNDPYIDTGCDRRTAYDRFFDFVESNYPPSIAIIGAGCSTASEPVAEIAPFWSVPVIAYVSASPLLSNRLRYPNFYRTYISDSLIAPAFVTLTKSFGWTRLLIISENEPVFVENIREQEALLEEAGVAVSSNSFQFNTNQLDDERLIEAIAGGDHVFFINTFEDAARYILCFFHRKGLQYPAYAFMTHAWFQEDWYLKKTTVCTREQVQMQLHRVITFVPFIVNEDREAPTFSGLSANEFDQEYRDRLSQTTLIYQPEGYTAFDAVYSMAIALDNVQTAVCNGDNLGCSISTNLTSIEDFEYYDAQLECMVKTALSNTDFVGVSGRVRFDEDGTRIVDSFEIKQYRMNNNECSISCLSHVTIGAVNVTSDTFRYIGNNDNNSVWPEGIPPDGTPIEITNNIHIALIIMMDIMAIVGVAFAIVCLVFNIVFRNKRIVKLTSPNLNYAIIIGAFFSYGSIFLGTLPGTDNSSLIARCDVSYVFTIFGYTISFSAVLAKMWRVFYIFHNPTTKKRSLKDWHLLLVVSVLSGIVALLLLVGESVPILRRTAELVRDRENSDTQNDLNVTVTYKVYSCSASTASLIYEGVVFGYLFILQLVAVIFAFQTRKVKIRALNDAKQVIAIIYTTTVCLVVLILTAFALGGYLNATSALYALINMAATTIFLTLIFVPKMISLYRDPKGEKVFSTSADTAPSVANNSTGSYGLKKKPRSLSAAALGGFEDSKVLIQKLENRVSQLREELDQYEQSPKVITADSRKMSVSFRDDITIPSTANSNGRNKSMTSEENSPTNGTTTGGGILKSNGDKLTEDTGNCIKEE